MRGLWFIVHITVVLSLSLRLMSDKHKRSIWISVWLKYWYWYKYYLSIQPVLQIFVCSCSLILSVIMCRLGEGTPAAQPTKAIKYKL